MNTISHYYLSIAKESNVRRMAITALEVQKTLAMSMLRPDQWIVTTVYQDGHTHAEDGAAWLYANHAPESRTDAPMPAFYSMGPQDTLRAALDRYNERYDNTLYLAACHSLREIEDQAEYILQAVRIQDVALWLCGAENVPCVTPPRITREMVNFWHAFSEEIDDETDASDLPF